MNCINKLNAHTPFLIRLNIPERSGVRVQRMALVGALVEALECPSRPHVISMDANLAHVVNEQTLCRNSTLLPIRATVSKETPNQRTTPLHHSITSQHYITACTHTVTIQPPHTHRAARLLTQHSGSWSRLHHTTGHQSDRWTTDSRGSTNTVQETDTRANRQEDRQRGEETDRQGAWHDADRQADVQKHRQPGCPLSKPTTHRSLLVDSVQ